MTYPRSSLVSVADTPYYHCICRCVRRAFLCGEDRLTGKSFAHRRGWILDRLRLLTEVFAIDLCAYALMSNHYHLVVRIAAGRAATWTDEEVIARWTRVFAGPLCIQRPYELTPTAADNAMVDALVRLWRARLADLSWFMRCLNEIIARMANREDECTGRFWEGRFKCQALLDPGALLTAMAYVDLNPVRAGIADGLEDSNFTSVQARLFDIARGAPAEAPDPDIRAPRLLPFLGTECAVAPDHLPFNLQDYLDLVDAGGRQTHPAKRGIIAAGRLPLLEVLGINADEWLATVTQLQRRFELVLGAPHRLRLAAEAHGRRWHRGQRAAMRLYRRATS
jgi:REP element-mobilizing transposase RayT